MALRTIRPACLLTLVVAAGIAGSGLGGAAAPAATEPLAKAKAKRGIELRKVAGFDSPTYVTRAPGRANRKLLFVVERTGTVRVLSGNEKLKRPFIDISRQVSAEGETGLLSIAFDPDYAENRRFYLYFTDPEYDIRVDSFVRSKRSPTVAKPRGRTVIEIPNGNTVHHGGTAMFGPDGALWLGTGDGGTACDPTENAQNPESLLGKMLRISPQPGGGYTVPADNPFVGGAGRDEIVAVGLRNPYRFSFDRPTGTIAIGDVGQTTTEEINLERTGSLRGTNFGWDAFEGNEPLDVEAGGIFCANDEPTPPPADHERPVHTYPHADSGTGHTGCSVTGGLVVRDRSLPSLFGRYVYADFCTGRLRSFEPALSGAVEERSAGLQLGSPTSFGTGRANRLYVTSLSGELYRIAAKAKRSRAPSRSERAGDGRGGFTTDPVAGFDAPVYVVGPPGANGLIFVVEQRGVIRLIKDGKKLSGSFLDISDKVEAGGERGLLSVAFAPRYAENRRFYVFFTDDQGDLKVQEYRRSRKNPRDAKEGSARTVLEVNHRQNANHNGGQLQFGPDGLLYIATGDGGSAGDPPENAQNKDSLLGKILRVDPRRDGKRAYRVPAANPFVGRPGADEVFAYGLRNPYRFSFDRKQQRITIGDVGQDSREEIDIETIDAARGANFGWDAFEGFSPFQSSDASPPPTNHTAPIHDYKNGGGNCAVTGGVVARDRRIPSLLGRYVYADFCGGQIRSLQPKGNGIANDRRAGLANERGLSSFGTDGRGRVWFTNLVSGEVVRIKPR